MTEIEARMRCRSTPGSVWAVLMSGERTVPSIALEVGRDLGMTPDEVAHLGKTLPARWWLINVPNHRKPPLLADVAPEWPTLLSGSRIMWKRLKPWQYYFGEDEKEQT